MHILLLWAGLAGAQETAPWIEVPPGHATDEGTCRVWIVGLAPGRQADPVPCSSLRRADLEHVYVVVGDRGWAADRDWVAYERAHPGTVPDVLLEREGPDRSARRDVRLPGGGGPNPPEVREREQARDGLRQTGQERDLPGIATRGPRETEVPARYLPQGRDACRLWYPGRDAVDQPEAGPCASLAAPRAGQGAFLLYRGYAWDLDFDWASWAERHPEEDVPRLVRDLTMGRASP